jgi:hypothetical protein
VKATTSLTSRSADPTIIGLLHLSVVSCGALQNRGVVGIRGVDPLFACWVAGVISSTRFLPLSVAFTRSRALSCVFIGAWLPSCLATSHMVSVSLRPVSVNNLSTWARPAEQHQPPVLSAQRLRDASHMTWRPAASLRASFRSHSASLVGSSPTGSPDTVVERRRLSSRRSSTTSSRNCTVAASNQSLQVGEEFAAAIDIALTGALGITSQRTPRRRSPRIESLLVQTNKPPSEEELLAIGIDKLASLGRWQLLTEVPPDDDDSFPMQACWTEVKQCWASGTLDEYDRISIARSVSWLARDLRPNVAQQREMARLTDADVPEQIAAQCRTGGLYADQFDALTDWQDADELVEPLAAIQPLIAHAAMSPAMRVHYMLPAIRRLASAVHAAAEASGLGWWEQKWWNRAAIDGFIYELRLAHAGSSTLDLPKEPWTANDTPAAYGIGRHSAEALVPLARRMRIHSFPGDNEAVEGRLQEVHPDERLDFLGWDIYLLARARGDTSEHAFSLAMNDTLSGRQEQRNDLLKRSLREIEN